MWNKKDGSLTPVIRLQRLLFLKTGLSMQINQITDSKMLANDILNYPELDFMKKKYIIIIATNGVSPSENWKKK